ncbi:hypothetical protein H7H37_26460 [Mycolicibacterium insubricum]|nr:hypothetical protein [Mycolicibacterium insubricum]
MPAPVSRRGMCHPHYEQYRKRRHAYGSWESRYTDAAPVRAHIDALLAAGVGRRRIAELAGIRRSVVQQVLNGRGDRGTGPSNRMLKTNADKILAVTIPELAEKHTVLAAGALVPAVGTARRLQALVAFGYPQSWLATRLGATPTNATRWFHNTDSQILAATARAVAVLFAELQLTPGPSARARHRGARLGWAPPMAWDEDTIDDPDATPHTGTGERVPFPETWAEMCDLGLTIPERLHALNTNPQALIRRLGRNGLPVDPLLLALADDQKRASA